MRLWSLKPSSKKQQHFPVSHLRHLRGLETMYGDLKVPFEEGGVLLRQVVPPMGAPRILCCHLTGQESDPSPCPHDCPTRALEAGVKHTLVTANCTDAMTESDTVSSASKRCYHQGGAGVCSRLPAGVTPFPEHGSLSLGLEGTSAVMESGPSNTRTLWAALSGTRSCFGRCSTARRG